MKNVTFADKSLLIGDEAADLLLEYATALANATRADAVRVRAISSTGEAVEATLLLDPGAVLMAETTTTPTPEPDNGATISYMRDRIQRLSRSTSTSRFTADDLREVGNWPLD